MKRLAILVAVALALGGGTARGDTAAPAAPVTPDAAPVVSLPGAGVPNVDGALVLAPDWLQPPAQPEQLTPEQLQGLWQAAGSAYGIPWQVLAAINKIESNFGRNMGPSSAGAIGWMQFMPSTWTRWGTDADGNGIADPWSAQDAVYSAARYLAASGGGADIRSAVFSYNHADWYVNEVLDLARLYGYGSSDAQTQPAAQPTAQAAAPAPVPVQASPPPAPAQTAPASAPAPQPVDQSAIFALDRLQVRLDATQQAVATASAEYQAAAERARALEGQEATLVRRAANAVLLSDRLDLQAASVQVSLDRQQAQIEAAAMGEALRQGQAELKALQDEAAAASFNRPAATVLAAPIPATTTTAPAADPATPAPAGNWVFPVGGGPDVVSVSHWHHDYPAADIAAPAGSPVYALSDAHVLRAWTSPDARCGIGLTLQTTDGQVWTYCHLAYLDPAVQAGVDLAAGASVGLVGMTGHASGPHLHLQLQPATSYPQNEAWFQSFAGAAFRWQDAATPGA